MSRTPSSQEPLLLAGAPNFRAVAPDLAGLRPGLLYRSGDLAALTAEDLERLNSLGLDLLLDLRSDVERKSRPNRWPEHTQTETVELLLGRVDVDVRARHAALRKILSGDPSPTGARKMMLATYAGLPQAVSASLASLLSRLAQGRGPVLIQCTVGKDRTGFTVACVLRALGYGFEAIIEDYLLTRHCVDIAAMRSITGQVLGEMLDLRLSAECLDTINGVEPDYLLSAFAAIDRHHGSFDAYLRSLDIPFQVIDRLRQALLFTAPSG